EPEEGATRRRSRADPARPRRVPARRVGRAHQFRSGRAGSGRELGHPRRRGRNVSERPLGDGAALERRSDRLRAQPRQAHFAQGPDGDVSMKIALLAGVTASVSTAAVAQTYERTQTGIVVTPAQGPEGAVRLQVYGDEIIRISATPTKELNLPQSLMVIARPMSGN